MFVICAYMVLQRRHKIHWVIQVLGLALFVLASVDIAYTMWLLFGKFLKGDLLIFFTYLRPKYWLYVTNRYVLWHLSPSASGPYYSGDDSFVFKVFLQTLCCSIDVTSSGTVTNVSWLSQRFCWLQHQCVATPLLVHLGRCSFRNLGYTLCWHSCLMLLWLPWRVGSSPWMMFKTLFLIIFHIQQVEYGGSHERQETLFLRSFCIDIMVQWWYC